MRKLSTKFFAVMLSLIGTSVVVLSCTSKDAPGPVKQEDKKWIVVYKDVLLGDQNNNTLGQFFKTQTGEAVSIQNAFSAQGHMSMVYFTEYGNNRMFLTFPGNARNESFSKEDETNNLFDRPSVGLNFWEASNLNSGEITHASTSSKTMSKSEFDNLASTRSWSDFDAKFKEFNSGAADLSFVANSMSPENGTVYMIQLNNTIRGFVYIKNVAPGGASGGSLKFDMVIEGGGEYSTDPSTVKINPSKD